MLDSEKDNVNSINLSKMNGSDKVPTVVNLQVAVITKFRAQCPDEDLNEKIDFLLDKETFEYCPILKFNGRTKIRSDVLVKFKKIADLLELLPNYPIVRPIQVKNIIYDVLGSSDYRISPRYMKSFTECIKSNPKNKSLLNGVDCSDFVQIVNEKISEKFQ